MSRTSRNFLWALVVIGFLVNFSIPSVLQAYTYEESFVVGTATSPPSIDPLDGYDSESQELIMQVCEGLYRYNFSSSENEPIPCLAKEMAVRTGNNMTLILHENVTFHDGSKFNASAVKWTFDRIQYFTSGLYSEDGALIGKAIQKPNSYDLFFINDVPILNSTIIESEYVVTFVINFGCGLWENILANSLTAFHLPDENYQYGHKFCSLLTIEAPLIGTGPFKLIKYDFDNEIVFEYFEEYRLPKPENYIKRMIYKIIPDNVTRSLGILKYEIHWGSVIDCYCDDFGADPNLVEIETKSCVIFFIQMNMENMPLEVRKASAFAYNYTYLHEYRHYNQSLYLHTPIPDGMQFHLKNYTGEPYTNLTHARNLILSCPELAANISSSGLSIHSTTEEWQNVAEGSDPLAWYNFTGYTRLEYHYEQLSNDMKDIGIRIDMVPLMPWGDYFNDYLENKTGNKRLCYSLGGWGPDYNDPINMIEPLYHSNGSDNYFLLSNPILDGLILDTKNMTLQKRREKFYSIQEILATDLMPSFYIYQREYSVGFNKLYVNESTVQDLLNAFSFFYWANVQFHPPQDFYQEHGIAVVVGIIIFSVVSIVVANVLLLIDYRKHPRKNSVIRKFYCPECGNVFKGPNYCRFCGYKIDKNRIK